MLEWIAEHRLIALSALALVVLAVVLFLRMRKDNYVPVDLWDGAQGTPYAANEDDESDELAYDDDEDDE